MAKKGGVITENKRGKIAEAAITKELAPSRTHYVIDDQEYLRVTAACGIVDKSDWLGPWYGKMEKEAVGKILDDNRSDKDVVDAIEEYLVYPKLAAKAYTEERAAQGNEVHEAINEFIKSKGKMKKLLAQMGGGGGKLPPGMGF